MSPRQNTLSDQKKVDCVDALRKLDKEWNRPPATKDEMAAILSGLCGFTVTKGNIRNLVAIAKCEHLVGTKNGLTNVQIRNELDHLKKWAIENGYDPEAGGQND